MGRKLATLGLALGITAAPIAARADQTVFLETRPPASAPAQKTEWLGVRSPARMRAEINERVLDITLRSNTEYEADFRCGTGMNPDMSRENDGDDMSVRVHEWSHGRRRDRGKYRIHARTPGSDDDELGTRVARVRCVTPNKSRQEDLTLKVTTLDPETYDRVTWEGGWTAPGGELVLDGAEQRTLYPPRTTVAPRTSPSDVRWGVEGFMGGAVTEENTDFAMGAGGFVDPLNRPGSSDLGHLQIGPWMTLVPQEMRGFNPPDCDPVTVKKLALYATMKALWAPEFGRDESDPGDLYRRVRVGPGVGFYHRPGSEIKVRSTSGEERIYQIDSVNSVVFEINADVNLCVKGFCIGVGGAGRFPATGKPSGLVGFNANGQW